MIKNAREYQITKAQVARFERALGAELEAETGSLAALAQDAIRSQLADLRAELEDYDALESGRVRLLEVDDLEELPTALIRARVRMKKTLEYISNCIVGIDQIQNNELSNKEKAEYVRGSINDLTKILEDLGYDKEAKNIRNEIQVGK